MESMRRTTVGLMGAFGRDFIEGKQNRYADDAGSDHNMGFAMARHGEGRLEDLAGRDVPPVLRATGAGLGRGLPPWAAVMSGTRRTVRSRWWWTGAEFREALQGVQIAVHHGWKPAEVAAHLGNDISAVGSVPSALAAFLLNPHDVRDAVMFAIEMGGDTDTVAAMTGAIAGAGCGVSGLPGSWVGRLERAGEIRDLADALATIGA
jgi:hypothetical protein